MGTKNEEYEYTKKTGTGSRLRGPVAVGLFFGLLGTVLSLVGLGRAGNLTVYNAALAVLLGGGVWGLIAWAIATAAVEVEEEEDSPQRREERKEE